MNEIEEYTIECSICLEESSVDNFHQITYGIVGQEPEMSIIVEEGCKGCLLAEDIRIYSKTRKRLFDYDIINQEKYIKARKINWVKKVLQEDPRDFVSVSNATKIMEEKGVLNFIPGKEKAEKVRSAKDFLKIRIQRGILEDLITIPTTLRIGIGGVGPSKHFTYIIRKSDLHRIIDFKLKGVIQRSRTHEVSIEKLKELEEQDYVFFKEEEDGSVVTSFFVNKEDEKTPCRKCGEIKLFNEFRYSGKKKLTFICFECESKKNKAVYANYSSEEYEKVQARVQAWRKANKDKCREYSRIAKRTPQARANRNVRRRLKDFLKKAKNHHFSKNIGCTKKELIEHLESQFTEGMSWENYGSGKNGDHVGSWHIDHKDPISKFKGDYPNHYTNLQPMWSIDNMRKGNKVDTPV